MLSRLSLLLSIVMVTEAAAFTVSPLMGRFSGHEEITRQAVIMAHDVVRNKLNIEFKIINEEDILEDLRARFLGTSGARTSNLLISGNFAMDVPDKDWVVKDLAALHYPWAKDYPEFDWHTNPHGQTAHFLRNLKLRKKTCLHALENSSRHEKPVLQDEG